MRQTGEDVITDATREEAARTDTSADKTNPRCLPCPLLTR